MNTNASNLMDISSSDDNESDWNNQVLLQADMFQDYPDWMLTFAFSCCVLFLICGLPGNIITILALCRCKKVRNTTAIFIINLSISDLLFGCFNLPLAASVFITRHWIWGRQLCQLYPFLRYGLLAVSIFNILAITINRYIMIAHPKIYPRLYSGRYLPIQVVGTWIGGFGSLIPTLLSVWGRFGLDPVIGSCTILPDRNGRSPKKFLFIFAFLAPCFAIILCYARIFMIAHKAAKKSSKKTETRAVEYRPENDDLIQVDNIEKAEYSSSIPSSHLSSVSTHSKDTVTSSLQPPSPFIYSKEVGRVESGEEDDIVDQPDEDYRLPVRCKAGGGRREGRRESCISFSMRVPTFENGLLRDRTRRKSLRPGRLTQKDRRLLRMILVIFVSFLVCYLPITVVKIVRDPSQHLLSILGYVLIYLTTCINPIIYVLMSSEYRQAYRSLLTCQTHSTRTCRTECRRK